MIERDKVALVTVHGSLRCRVALDRDAHLGEVAKLRRRHQGHADRAVRRHFERSVGDEPRHRFAHRHDGDAEHIGRRAQRQFFARREPPGNQEVRELRIGALAQRLSLERFHQIERGGQIQRKGSMLAQISAGLNFRERTRQRLCLLQL